MIYDLGLGSNLGRRRRNLERARARLEEAGVKVLRVSSVYETEPVGVVRQPWFLNQVLEVRTALTPQEVLELVKAIERSLKRVPTVDKGPRTIDIDLLLAGETVLETPGLVIPHPRLAERNFVLVPLAEIAPRAVHPVLRRTIRELLRLSTDTSRVEKTGGRKAGERAPRLKRRS